MRSQITDHDIIRAGGRIDYYRNCVAVGALACDRNGKLFAKRLFVDTPWILLQPWPAGLVFRVKADRRIA